MLISLLVWSSFLFLVTQLILWTDMIQISVEKGALCLKQIEFDRGHFLCAGTSYLVFLTDEVNKDTFLWALCSQ